LKDESLHLIVGFDFPPHESDFGTEMDVHYLFLSEQLDSASAVAELNFAKYFTWNF
jgi:hypothetical protein